MSTDESLNPTDFTECDRCEDALRAGCAIDGKCSSCYALTNDIGSTVEIPKATLKKLMSKAKTRHPTACNEVAPNMEKILQEEGLLDE